MIWALILTNTPAGIYYGNDEGPCEQICVIESLGFDRVECFSAVWSTKCKEGNSNRSYSNFRCPTPMWR